jgi:hypothetical protein
LNFPEEGERQCKAKKAGGEEKVPYSYSNECKVLEPVDLNHTCNAVRHV